MMIAGQTGTLKDQTFSFKDPGRRPQQPWNEVPSSQRFSDEKVDRQKKVLTDIGF